MPSNFMRRCLRSSSGEGCVLHGGSDCARTYVLGTGTQGGGGAGPDERSAHAYLLHVPRGQADDGVRVPEYRQGRAPIALPRMPCGIPATALPRQPSDLYRARGRAHQTFALTEPTVGVRVPLIASLRRLSRT